MPEEIGKDAPPKKEKPSIPKAKGWLSNSEYYEPVLMDGESVFLIVDVNTGKIRTSEVIEYDEITIRPPYKSECGYDLPSFTSEEFKRLAESKITREEILEEVLRMVQKYIVAPYRDQFLIALENVLTFSQEWTNTMHFLFLVGETESGKTMVLYLIKKLGYHCIVSSSLTYASIYNILDMGGEGSVTICEDEAQDVGSDAEKIKIYKGSYTRGIGVPRVDKEGRRKTIRYYPSYCMKILAGESAYKDKGLLERTVKLHMREGKPQTNLKLATRSELHELQRIHNKMLIWKMQNIRVGLPKISSGLSNRDQELWDSALALASGTKYEGVAKEVVEYYVAQRKQSIRDSLEATIFRIIRDMVVANPKIRMLEAFAKIVDSDELPGRLDDSGKTFYPHYFDVKITLNYLSGLFLDKYHAKRIKRKEDADGKSKEVTYYVFDEETVKALSEKYRV